MTHLPLQLLLLVSTAAPPGGVPADAASVTARPMPPRPVTAGWTSLADRLSLHGMLVGRYQWVEPARDEANPLHSFAIARARLELEGELSRRLVFGVHVDFAYRGIAPQLLEAWVGYRFADPGATLFVGQIKPMSLHDGQPRFWQFITGGNSGATFDWDKWDRGLALRGMVLGHLLHYEAHLVNGNGIDARSEGENDNPALRAGLLVRIQPLGMILPYHDDLDHSPFAFGLNFAAARSRDDDPRVRFQDKTWLAAGLVVKGGGFFAKLTAAQLDVSREGGRLSNQRYLSAQASYSMLLPAGHALELLGRYTYLDADRDNPGGREEWTTVGFNYFVWGRWAKAQLNYIFKAEEAGAELDNDTLLVAFTFLI